MKYLKIILCINLCFINHTAQPFIQQLWDKLIGTNQQSEQDKSSKEDQTLTPERAQFFARILRGDRMEDVAPSDVIPENVTLPNGTSPVQFAIQHKNTHAIVNLINAGYNVTHRDYESARFHYQTSTTHTKNPFTWLQNKSQQLYSWILCYFLRSKLDPQLLSARGKIVINFESPQAKLVQAARENDVLSLWDMLERNDTNPNTPFLAEEALETALFHQNTNVSILLLDDPRTIVTEQHQNTLSNKALLLTSNILDTQDPYPGNAQHGSREQRLDQDLQELLQLEQQVMQKIQKQNPNSNQQSKIQPFITKRTSEKEEQARQKALQDSMRMHKLRQLVAKGTEINKRVYANTLTNQQPSNSSNNATPQAGGGAATAQSDAEDPPVLVAPLRPSHAQAVPATTQNNPRDLARLELERIGALLKKLDAERKK